MFEANLEVLEGSHKGTGQSKGRRLLCNFVLRCPKESDANEVVADSIDMTDRFNLVQVPR